MTELELNDAAAIVNLLRREGKQHSANVVQALIDEAMRKRPKLYVWEGVLEDYTCGMVVVLASSDEEANAAIKDEYFANDLKGVVLDGVTPEVVDLDSVKEARHWHVYGGG